MKHKFDVLIVGGGCVGSSVLFSLAGRGIKNIGLVDSGQRTTSATARCGGMIRIFHEDPRHTEMAIRSCELLERYRHERRVGFEVHQNGSLYFFNKSRYKSFEQSLRRMDESGCCYEIIGANDGRKIFPEFRWDDDDLAIYESTGKYIEPLAFVQELLRYGRSCDAVVFEDSEVLEIVADDSGYQLVFADKILNTKKLILAGGSRILPLLADLCIDLPLESKSIHTIFSPNTPEFSALPNYFDRETLEYARFGMGPFVVRSNKMMSRMQNPRRLGVGGEQSTADCYAPDRIGLVVSPQNHPNITVASDWGGTAFKFSLEIGRQVAAHIMHSKLHMEEGVYASSTP